MVPEARRTGFFFAFAARLDGWDFSRPARQRRVRDDEKPKDAVTKAANAADEVIEVVGLIPAAILATWGMTEGEVRLILPGEPISG